MSMWRTLAGATAIAALALLTSPAGAAQPGVLVTGDNLPANVDPHQIFDVPMQLYSLNTYDNLYRYEGNPPELRPIHIFSRLVGFLLDGFHRVDDGFSVG